MIASEAERAERALSELREYYNMIVLDDDFPDDTNDLRDVLVNVLVLFDGLDSYLTRRKVALRDWRQ